MGRISIFYVLLLAIISCKPTSPVTEESKTTSTDTLPGGVINIPGLERLWETGPTLTAVESVLFDKTNDVLYASCINGVPADKKDGDGFIARIALDGKIKNLKWVTGLNAPKGMGQSGNTLYVADIDRLVAIDIIGGKISRTWDVKGSKYLNDIYITADGTVYFTDSQTSTIYSLVNDTVAVVFTDIALGGTNGLLVEGNSFYLTDDKNGRFNRLDLDNKSIQKIAEEIPSGDGIERYGDAFFVSNWYGQVFHIAADGEVTLLLDSQEAKLNAADIEVIADKNLLLVPTFFGNTVTAYRLITPSN